MITITLSDMEWETNKIMSIKIKSSAQQFRHSPGKNELSNGSHNTICNMHAYNQYKHWATRKHKRMYVASDV